MKPHLLMDEDLVLYRYFINELLDESDWITRQLLKKQLGQIDAEIKLRNLPAAAIQCGMRWERETVQLPEDDFGISATIASFIETLNMEN